MRHFKKALIIFIFINLFLYLYMWKFNNLLPFRSDLYLYSSHHYLYDDRISGGKFDFLRSLGQWDAQWYLKIADSGYPKNPQVTSMEDKNVMDGLTYAFFPLYPALLAIFNLFIGYIELSAFIFSLMLLGANFYSLYFVVSKIYNENIAYKTTFLLFLFPFSIFYRSYFTEGLFLLLLIWYAYFLIQRKWLKASFSQGLLIITRPNGLFLLPVTIYLFIREFAIKNRNFSKLIINLLLIFGFFTIWLVFNWKMTGNIFFWKDVQTSWFSSQSILEILNHNYLLLKNFVKLPLHDIHASKIDLLIFYIAGWIIIYSYSFLKKELWWTAFVIWFIPLMLKDSSAYSRYQSVSFPVFIYLASLLNKKSFAVMAAVFYALLLFISLYFVNWNWIG